MHKTAAEIAKLIGGEVLGNQDIEISGLAGIKEAKPGDITFLANSKYFPLAKETRASVIIVGRDVTFAEKTLIRVENPSLAFSKLAAGAVEHGLEKLNGIHPTAVLAKDVVFGKNVAIGPHVVIESAVRIGDNTTIHAGSFIGNHTTLGSGCYIYPNVTLRERISIGNNVIIHSGTVIGSDGFGYVDAGGEHVKIPQVGTVLIEDDVEIGSNVTVDRARFDKTLIGRGSKIDNLVQIAHNVVIGERCIVVAQVGISGSVVIEKGAILAGQAGIAGHLTVGAGSVVLAQAGVTKSVPAGTQVSGYPAREHGKAREVNAYVQRLPVYIETLQDLKKRIAVLEDQLKKRS